MTEAPGKDNATAGKATGMARRIPTQRRSRERYERILDVATTIMVEKGSDAFKMSEVVERAGVSFGSLYQYFPDKTAIIGTLFERYIQLGRVCVEDELATVETIEDLHPALCRMVDGYYQMFLEDPAMREIWYATQSDKILQKLDEDDMKILSGILFEKLKILAPDKDKVLLATASHLIMKLATDAVRHAISLEKPEGEQSIALFKQMLPKDPHTLG